MPFIENGIVGTAWGTYRRKVATILTSVTVVTGAIVGIAKAGPIIEPWFYTSHGYLHEVVDEAVKNQTAATKAIADNLAATTAARQDKVDRVLHHMQIEQAEGKGEAADNNLFNAGLALRKATDDPTREYIQQQMLSLTATKKRIDSQIETLRKGGAE